MKILAELEPEYFLGDDVLAIGIYSDEIAEAVRDEGDRLAPLGRQVTAEVAALLRRTRFTGRLGERVTEQSSSGRTLILCGLGPSDQTRSRLAEEISPDDARRIGALVARSLPARKNPGVALHLPFLDPADAVAGRLVGAPDVAEGLALAVHEGRWNLLPDRFRADYGADLPAEPELVRLLGISPPAAALDRAEALTAGIVFARELVAAPSNLITPQRLVTEAGTLDEVRAGSRGMAGDGRFESTIRTAEECADDGLTGFAAAAQGGVHPARLLQLTYRPAGSPTAAVAVVGLGLTFDDRGVGESGGVVQGAKKYMAGAGAVLGAARTVAGLGSTMEIHFLIPAAEKAGGSAALREGDLVTTASGLTAEVNNPDAHGRLLLADALHLASTLPVDAIVSVATLGHSCARALGPGVAGLWADDDGLADALLAAGHRAGEWLWRLPLVQRYEALLWAPFANLRTHSAGPDDAATAALFLHRFSGGKPWAHLEITAPAWSDRVEGYYNAGATGFGTGTLAQWLCPPA